MFISGTSHLAGNTRDCIVKRTSDVAFPAGYEGYDSVSAITEGSTSRADISPEKECAMPDCERLNACPFFSGRMENMPSVAGLMKHMFCFGDRTQCARYQVASAGLPIPADLFPNDLERAQDILRDK